MATSATNAQIAGLIQSITDLTASAVAAKNAALAAASAAGAAGPQGIQGPKGDPGNPGANGTNGSNGLPGANGTNGLPGPSGPPGTDGVIGVNGTNGTNGAPGTVGPAGPAGTAAVIPLTEQVLTWSPNVVWPLYLRSYSLLNLTGSTIMANPSNLERGIYYLAVRRGAGAGQFTLGFSSAYRWEGNTVPEPSITDETEDIYEFISDGLIMKGRMYRKGIPTGAVVAPTAAVLAPTNLTLSNITASSTRLDWNPSTNAVSYNVYRNATKANSTPITTNGFVANGLVADTAYTWVVKAVNSAGAESTAGATVSSRTSANVVVVDANGLIAVPADVIAMYHEVYEYPFTFTLNDIPSQVNTVYLFNMQPAGTPAVPNQRDNLGDGTFQMPNAGEPPISNDKIAALRARGVRVILTVGGAWNGFNFDTRTRSNNFITSFKNMVTQLGGKIDGIDWNTFEAYLRQISKDTPAAVTTNTSEMVYISQTLRDFYGPNFSVTMPPSPDAIGVNAYSPYDLVVAKALNAAGLLSYVAPQFYDTAYVKGVDYVYRKMVDWINELGPTKVVLGLSHGNARGIFDDCLTLAEAEREVDKLIAAQPNTRGFFTWSMHDKVASSFPAYLTSMINRFSGGGTVVVPPPAVNTGEVAITNAFAYNGGQNGAWFDPQLNYLQKNGPSTVINANDPVWTWLDRSSNANNVYIASGAEAYYRDLGAFKALNTYAEFTSNGGGGGSGDRGGAASTNFFICLGAKVLVDYPFIWSDQVTINDGRSIQYESYLGRITFRVGTGATNVQIASQVLAPLNANPPNINVLVKAWQTSTEIFLQVNGGIIVSAACAACSSTNIDFALNGGFFAGTPGNGFSGSDIYYSVHTLSDLTPALRDGVEGFVRSKTPT